MEQNTNYEYPTPEDYGYISIKVILDKLMRHPLMANISLETVADYCIDFMRIVGCQNMFIEKAALIKITKYQGILPDDYFSMIQVRGDNNVFRYSSDSFHMSPDKQHTYMGGQDYTYKIQGRRIFTSIEEGEIEITYQSIPVSKDGLPMIPDNSKFTRALEAYIKKQWFTILFDLGKIQPAVLQNIQQEYAWAVGAYETDCQMFNLDVAESFYNSWRTLLVRDREHSLGFIDNGAKQNLKIV